jgi:VanZ family protein
LRSSASRARTLAIAASVLAVLIITLTAIGDKAPLPFSPTIGEGRRWLADGLLNLILIVPLGFAIAWRGRSIVKAAALGMLLSVAVEVSQLWIAGRDSSLSDVLFNSVGAAVGASLAQNPVAWIFPNRALSRKLTAVALATLMVVLAVTAFLLSPTTDAFTLRRDGGELALAFPSRADNIGLDAPEYWLSPPSTGVAAGPVTATRDRARWLVRTGPQLVADAGATVGDGWALLAYPDAIARRWGTIVSALWMMMGCISIGYWARRGSVAFAAAGAIALLLIALPVILGIARTPLTEWAGAAFGLVAGLCLGEAVQRREPA